MPWILRCNPWSFTKTILEGVKKEILGDKYSYFHTEEIDKLRSQYPFVETFLNSKEAEELAKIRAKKDMIKGEESPDIVKYFSISADELNQSKIKEDRRKTSLKELEKQIEEKENPDFIFYKIERTNDVLSKEEKELFLTFKEINPFEIIKQAAIRQKYIDQAMSLNLMFDPNDSPKYISDVHKLAWSEGIKTLYYCRSESILRGNNISRNNECISCEG